MRKLDSFKTKTELRAYIREFVAQPTLPCVFYPGQEEFIFIREILALHPAVNIKIKDGVIALGVFEAWGAKNRQFRLQKTNGEWLDFSWLKCLGAKVDHLKSAMRESIHLQIINFRRANGNSRCGICGGNSSEMHVDHFIPFSHLVRDFIRGKTCPVLFEECLRTNRAVFRIEDMDFSAAWQDFHSKNALLRMACATCNIRRG